MKEGAWTEMDKAREYVAKVAAENPCPITEEQRAALDEAFIRVCADAGLTEAAARDLIKKYDEA